MNVNISVDKGRFPQTIHLQGSLKDECEQSIISSQIRNVFYTNDVPVVDYFSEAYLLIPIRFWCCRSWLHKLGVLQFLYWMKTWFHSCISICFDCFLLWNCDAQFSRLWATNTDRFVFFRFISGTIGKLTLLKIEAHGVLGLEIFYGTSFLHHFTQWERNHAKMLYILWVWNF